MDDKEKDFVRDYNATIKHGDPIDKITMPQGISVKTRPCRTSIKEEPDVEPKRKGNDRKKKGVTFGLTDADHVDHGDE